MAVAWVTVTQVPPSKLVGLTDTEVGLTARFTENLSK